MTAHTLASNESENLCDQLFAALQEVIPNLQRSSTKGSCGLYQEGSVRFAYVYHATSKPQIVVWCRGDAAELQRHDNGLGVEMRDNQSPGWTERFLAHFRITKAEQISAAARLLAQVSFTKSK
jgi:hypothetical protein